MSTLLLYGTLFICSLLITACFLWLGAKLVKIPKITLLRALATLLVLTFVEFLAGFGVTILVQKLLPSLEAKAVPALLIGIAQIIAILLLSWLVTRWMFHTTFGKAILVWFSRVIAAGLLLALVFLVIKPFMLEAWVVSNNSMAPTLVGEHSIATCPKCGGTLIVPFEPNRMFKESLAICQTCNQPVYSSFRDSEVHSADRFICNKLMTPKRWDAVVFRSTEGPSDKYVKRIIGLPGEEVVLKEGGIWINGNQLTPPEDLADLYRNAEFAGQPFHWATPEDPAHLGDDEFFVLGDFTNQSRDSRLWKQGILRSNIEGVVTLIYWPPSRWRVFR